MWVSTEARRGHQSPWSWSHKRLWATNPHGCWEPNSGFYREQLMALAIKPSPQLLSFTLRKHLLLLLYQHPWREHHKSDQLACILLTRPTEAWERSCSDNHEGGKYRLRGGWTSFVSVSFLLEPLYYTWSPAGNKTSQERHWKWEPFFMCVWWIWIMSLSLPHLIGSAWSH